MHKFLHGIRCAFLAACGGSLFPCLPALVLPKEAENNDLLAVLVWRPQEVKKGAIQPILQGSDNSNLKPSHDNHSDDGCLLPLSGEEEGFLPPHKRGDDEFEAVNTDLQPKIKGQFNDGEGPVLPSLGDEDVANIDLPTKASRQEFEEHGGKFHPVKEDNDGGLPPMLAINKENAIIQASIVSFHVHGMHVFRDAYSLKISIITYMHAPMWKTPKASMVHDDVVIVHAKPRVDPKVKKTSLLLCLFINMPFHPSEHGYDGIFSSRHHEPCSLPYSTPCLYIECSCPSVPYSPKAPLSSDFSLLVILSNDDKAAYGVLKVTTKSIELPFIPLRGSKRCQAREREDDGLYRIKDDEDRDDKDAALLHYKGCS